MKGERRPCHPERSEGSPKDGQARPQDSSASPQSDRRPSTFADHAASRPLQVAVVLGTRPEAVKLAPVILELRTDPEHFSTEVILTGQHRQLAREILAGFGIAPELDLDIMTERQSLTQVTVRSLEGLSRAFSERRPELVLVEGDAAAVFTGSLAAFYHQIPVGHVEAGLRTGDKYHPFPEEIYRRLTGVLADLHFPPTAAARDNLLKEGVAPERIFVTGNTVIDALLRAVGPGEPAENRDRLILVTTHRRENWGEPIARVCRAIKQLVERFPEVEVIYSVHPNPVVRRTAERELAGLGRVRLVPPPGYFEFVELMKRAYLVLTDSGGVQEEAPSLGLPVLVLRDATERPEAVWAGTAQVVGTDPGRIVAAASQLLADHQAYQRMARAVNPFGDGRASQRVRQALLHHFFGAGRPEDYHGERD